ncbi:MAG: hypothetical protein EXR67_00850 [Dehalococcoidia bacterium]|nr:hypothetical protein [Dehalococcoidia bacterium]
MPILVVLALVVFGVMCWLITSVREDAVWVDVYYTYGSAQDAYNLNAELEEHGIRCHLRRLGMLEQIPARRLTTVRVHRDDLPKAQPIVAQMLRR